MSSRRTFLKTAGALGAGVATIGTAAACAVKDPDARNATLQDAGVERMRGFDATLLEALAQAVLPASLGASAIRAATAAFVEWADGYEPVAEEMHGYGYADIRYLPPDPSPAWRAQLAALDLLARKQGVSGFALLSVPQRQEVLRAALRTHTGDRIPAPLEADHIAVAVLAHWSSSPTAWDTALGAQVAPGICRTLADTTRKPLPLAAPRTAGAPA